MPQSNTLISAYKTLREDNLVGPLQYELNRIVMTKHPRCRFANQLNPSAHWSTWKNLKANSDHIVGLAHNISQHNVSSIWNLIHQQTAIVHTDDLPDVDSPVVLPIINAKDRNMGYYRGAHLRYSSYRQDICPLLGTDFLPEGRMMLLFLKGEPMINNLVVDRLQSSSGETFFKAEWQFILHIDSAYIVNMHPERRNELDTLIEGYYE